MFFKSQFAVRMLNVPLVREIFYLNKKLCVLRNSGLMVGLLLTDTITRMIMIKLIIGVFKIRVKTEQKSKIMTTFLNIMCVKSHF